MHKDIIITLNYTTGLHKAGDDMAQKANGCGLDDKALILLNGGDVDD